MNTEHCCGRGSSGRQVLVQVPVTHLWFVPLDPCSHAELTKPSKVHSALWNLELFQRYQRLQGDSLFLLISAICLGRCRHEGAPAQPPSERASAHLSESQDVKGEVWMSTSDRSCWLAPLWDSGHAPFHCLGPFSPRS